jgi:hypothetical protein
MAIVDIGTYASLLRQYYTDDAVKAVVYKNAPLFAMLTKMEDMGGSTLPIPVIFEDVQGASNTFSVAQAAVTGISNTAFMITAVQTYAIAQVSRQVIKASEGKKGAWMPAARASIDSALRTVSRRIAMQLYRQANGFVGTVGVVAANVITLNAAKLAEIVNFSVGMQILAYAADGVTLRVGTMLITAVNRTAGTITVNAAAAGLIATDLLVINGNYGLATNGLLDWVPTVAPGATPFLGVNRSTDVTRLGGLRYDASASPISEGITKALSLAFREGASVDRVFMNPASYAALVIELGSKVLRDTVEVAKFGFSVLKIYHDGGEALIVSDPYCPPNIAFGLQMDTWKLYSIGPAADIFDRDTDQEMLRLSASDAYELRVGGYLNLGSSAPGYSINIALPPAT